MTTDDLDWLDDLPLRDPPRQRRSRQTVVRLLDTAQEIARTEGVSALTTSRLAEVSGLPVGTIYRYVSDREGLVACLVARERLEMDAVLLGKVATLSLYDWRTTVKELVYEVARFARERPAYLQLRSMAAASADDRVDAAWTRWLDALVTAPAVRSFGLPERKVRLYLTAAVGAVQGPLRQLYSLPDGEWQPLADEVVTMIVLYIEHVARQHGITMP
jgi:AcrR family transcriptional regulator